MNAHPAQTTPPISLLPNSNVRDIKDAGRNITGTIGYEQKIQDEVWVSLRKLFGTPEAQEHVDMESLRRILVAIEKHRPRIIELISDKECVRVIVGADKHVKQKRMELAGKVLNEIETKIKTIVG